MKNEYQVTMRYKRLILDTLIGGALSPRMLALRMGVAENDPLLDAAIDNLCDTGKVQRTHSAVWLIKPKKRRAWHSAKVLPDVNVSSSADYHFAVLVSHHDKRAKAHWSYCDQELLILQRNGNQKRQYMPKYLQREIYEQALRLLLNGDARFFEYDRDGNQRYSDLRYHDARLVDAMIAGLQNRVEAQL